MKCPVLNHSGLASGSYNGPTHTIEQYSLRDALEQYGLALDPISQRRQSNIPPSAMPDWHSYHPELANSDDTFAITTAECTLQTPDGLVSVELRADLAQKEPVVPQGSVLEREYFDVSGCGALVTAACAFVAKSVPWEAMASGGTVQISTKYSGNNLPEIHLVGNRMGLPPSWQAARPFGQPVLLRLRPDRTAIDYDGRPGAGYSGGLYLTGSMVDLAKTAAAQTVALGRILNDSDRAERTVTHAYGGPLEALQEAWTRALSPEAETPGEAAELVYTILNQ